MLYKLNEIVKSYKGKAVLDLGLLEFRKGKVYTLLGPNGAGKSTLLNLLAFLEKPTSGALYFDDRSVDFTPALLHSLRQRVVLLHQSPVMFTGTVWKNVEFGLEVRGINKLERKARIENALHQVGMEKFARFNAKTLSGGETKRVALARALAVTPEVLLLDEPTANVDVKNQRAILDCIKNLNTHQQTSVIFSTHMVEEADGLAHETVQLRDGKLVVEKRENLMQGQVSLVEGEDVLVRTEIEGFELKMKNGLKLQTGSWLQFSLDPCKLLLQKQKKECVAASFPGVLQEISLKEGLVHYRLTVLNGTGIRVVGPFEPYRKSPFHIGQEVCVQVPEGAARIVGF